MLSVCPHSRRLISWSIFTKNGTEVPAPKKLAKSDNDFVGVQHSTTARTPSMPQKLPKRGADRHFAAESAEPDAWRMLAEICRNSTRYLSARPLADPLSEEFEQPRGKCAARTYNRALLWGQSPHQRGPRAKGAKPPEAESFFWAVGQFCSKSLFFLQSKTFVGRLGGMVARSLDLSVIILGI